MFKSSENLRLAAEMRALERVARPWREGRTSWFDGSPESIEARLAATERVLTFARAGYTTAHMALEREAASARAELREASHRLLTDFLDDGARAFKGSKRVALDYGHGDINEPCNRCGAAPGEPCLDVNHFRPEDDPRQKKVRYLEDEFGARRQSGDPHPYDVYQQDPELFNKLHWGSRRVASDETCAECGEPVQEDPEYGSYVHLDEQGNLDRQDRGHYAEPEYSPEDLARWNDLGGGSINRQGSLRVAERGYRECVNCGGALSGEQDEDDEAECGTCGKSAHNKEGYRVARAPEENEDWEEGASYADYKGGKCTRCKSDNIDAAGYGTGEYDCYDCGATFHPKVRKLRSSVHTAAPEDEACEDCGAECGEDCRPWCCGKAKHDEEKD